jgi:hypothetical protein
VLQLPALDGFVPTDVCDAVVYADDADRTLFHVVAQTPKLRVDAEGRPTISLLRYRTLADDPSTSGGGFLDVGVQLGLDDDERVRVMETLKSRFGASARVTSPLVVGGSATAVVGGGGSGVVDVLAGSARPSLVDRLEASFSGSLTRLGTQLLWDELDAPVSPLTIAYELDVVARLPPMQVRAWFDARAARVKLVDTPSSGLRQMLLAARAGGVEVTSLAPDTPSSTQATIEAWAWHLVEAAAEGLRDRPVGSDAAAAAAIDACSFDLVFTDHVGVRWPLRPQGRIRPLSAGEKQAVSRSADLSVPIFDFARVDVAANIDFEEAELAEVHVGIGAMDARGVRKDSTIVLRSRNDQGSYTYDAGGRRPLAYDVGCTWFFRASSKRVEEPPKPATGAFHLVSASELGVAQLDIDANTLDWEYVSAASVEVSYGDMARSIEDRQEQLVLTRDAPRVRYRRAVFDRIGEPIRARCTLTLANSRRISTDHEMVNRSTLFVPSPFAGTSRLILRTGSFATQTTVVVDVEGPVSSKSLVLSAANPETLLLVPLVSLSDSVRYRQTVTFADGHSEVGNWASLSGSAELTVGDIVASRLVITPASDLIDWHRTRLVRLTVRRPARGSAAIEVVPNEQVVQRAITNGSVIDPITFDLAAGEQASYDWSAEYFDADSTRRTTTAVTTDQTVIVLQP